MERRKFVIGMGALATGSAAAMGTGAFSFARAERDLTVAVEGDETAFLGLKASSPYASGTDGGQLSVNFDEAADEGSGTPEGSGINENADTRFDNVFEIHNQGTNDVRISFHDTEGASGYESDAATWYYTLNATGQATGDGEISDNPVLSPGDYISVHVIFWMTDYDEGDLPQHLGITAEEP